MTVKINMLTIIVIIALLWIAYKYLLANRVKGKTVEIKPFRTNSKLKGVGTIIVRLEEIEQDGNHMWFICPMDETRQIGNFKFDYVKIRPKSVDDNFNSKKAIVAHVFAGYSASSESPTFIDWGLVKVVS